MTEQFSADFTFGKFEKKWIQKSLGDFFREDWITKVVRRVKSGKEATVYACRAHPATGFHTIAAKVYRPREHRAMGNYGYYRQGQNLTGRSGRLLREKRVQRAILKGSTVGKKVEHAGWLTHEFNVMAKLYQAGVDAPEPLAVNHNAILMDFIGTDDWPSHLLHEIKVPRDSARELFNRIMESAEIALSLDIIHGDLSPYNILMKDGVPYLIDFPQAVDVHSHPDAYFLLERDINRICRYFKRLGKGYDSEKITQKLWKQYTPYPCGVSVMV